MSKRQSYIPVNIDDPTLSPINPNITAALNNNPLTASPPSTVLHIEDDPPAHTPTPPSRGYSESAFQPKSRTSSRSSGGPQGPHYVPTPAPHLRHQNSGSSQKTSPSMSHGLHAPGQVLFEQPVTPPTQSHHQQQSSYVDNYGGGYHKGSQDHYQPQQNHGYGQGQHYQPPTHHHAPPPPHHYSQAQTLPHHQQHHQSRESNDFLAPRRPAGHQNRHSFSGGLRPFMLPHDATPVEQTYQNNPFRDPHAGSRLPPNSHAQPPQQSHSHLTTPFTSFTPATPIESPILAGQNGHGHGHGGHLASHPHRASMPAPSSLGLGRPRSSSNLTLGSNLLAQHHVQTSRDPRVVPLPRSPKVRPRDIDLEEGISMKEKRRSVSGGAFEYGKLPLDEEGEEDEPLVGGHGHGHGPGHGQRSASDHAVHQKHHSTPSYSKIAPLAQSHRQSRGSIPAPEHQFEDPWSERHDTDNDTLLDKGERGDQSRGAPPPGYSPISANAIFKKFGSAYSVVGNTAADYTKYYYNANWAGSVQTLAAQAEEFEKLPASIDEKPDGTVTDEHCISFGPEDARHPYSWSARKKWLAIIVLCSAAVCVTATSSIQASTYNSLQREFHVKRLAAVAGVSLYVLGFGIGALFLGPLSEFYGRSVIYLVSFALFTVFTIPIATAQNFGVLLFFRFVTGLCGSGFLAVAGGTVTDLFKPGTTDIPMAIYTLSPLAGPAIGPLIGGFINQNVSWRITFYTVIGWSGAELILLYFFVPETFIPIIQKKEAKNRRINTGNGEWYAPVERNGRKFSDVFPGAIFVPVKLMFSEKMALAMNMWTALILGIIYLFFNAIPFTFRTVYFFSLQQTGLCFIPMALGMATGTLCQFWFVRQIRNKAALSGGKATPESRLLVGMAGAVAVPVGLIWFAGSAFSKMPFMMPLIGTFIFGMGALFVFTSVFGFLVSTYPKYGASAMAGNTLLRCIWAAGFPLFADAMYRGLGPAAATGVLAAVAGLMSPIPFVLYRMGPKLRARSKYSS